MTEVAGKTVLVTGADGSIGSHLVEGLDETISWFSDPANLARYKADIYNV